jgi:hypothetical protein
MSRRHEIVEEFRDLFTGRRTLGDAALPPVVFAAADAAGGVTVAAGTSLAVALGFVAVRLARRRRLRYALGGLAGVLVAIVFALRSGNASDYFLPGIISNAAYTAVALLSIALRRPMVAWTSALFRGWPLRWYWRDDVRPAYTVVTWMWAAYFGARGGIQFFLYLGDETGWLAVARVLSGWPSLGALLAATYLLGTRRLLDLGGPSVAEYRAGSAPPFAGQRRGF